MTVARVITIVLRGAGLPTRVIEQVMILQTGGGARCCFGALAALLFVGCGNDVLVRDVADCGTDVVTCAEAGLLCGMQTLTDSCGASHTIDCGSCGSNGSCVLGGLICACNTGYSGDGYSCAPAIGLPCPVGDWTQQDCPDGQVCISEQGVSFCDIVNCDSDLQCGTNGIAVNSCAVTGGTRVCQLNCFPTQPNACNSADFVCLPASTAVVADVSQCVIDCHAEPSTWCDQSQFGSTCGDSGFCETTSCTTSADCPSGQICSVPSTGPTTAFCAPDCRHPGNACPQYAMSCDPSTGQCN